MDEMSKRTEPENQQEKDTGQEETKLSDTTATETPADKKGNSEPAKTSGKSFAETFMKDVEARPKFYKQIGMAAAAVLAFIICFAIAMSAGQGGKKTSDLSADLKAAAEERTELVVGINSSGVPPFIYLDYNGKYTGTDYSVMKSVCDFYGWDLVITPIDWSNREAVLTNGEVDCLWSGFNCYGREDAYNWSEPYQDLSDVVVVLKKNKDITTLEDLEDKKVAAVSESSAYYALGGIGIAMQRLGCTDLDQATELLKTGEADAVVMSKDEAKGIAGNYKVLDEYLDYNTYAVACALDDNTLPALLNHAFEQVG